MSIAAFGPGPQRSGVAGAAPAIVAPVAPLAPSTPADKSPVPGSPAPPRFAELLRRSRTDSTAPPPAAPVATPAPDDEPPDAIAPGETSAIEATAAPTNAAKARVAALPKGTGAGTVVADDGAKASGNVWLDVDGKGGGASDGNAPVAAATASSARAIDAATTAPIAIDASPPLRRGVDAEVDEGGGDGGASTSVRDSAARSLPPGVGAARDDAKSEPQAGVADAGASIPSGAETSVLAAFADVGRRRDDADSRPAHRVVDTLAGSFAAGPAARAADPSPHLAATAVLLPTSIDSPDFAAALGVQVRVLAKDGVQKAELHLNPAELGPVSIHISLDGSAARVDFGADVAATRQAIERGLPELASALQDAGFTLAGGGVSQHAGGRTAQENDHASAARHVGATGAALAASMSTTPGPITRRVAAGGVDLYA